jgi:hypothetical protein
VCTGTLVHYEHTVRMLCQALPATCRSGSDRIAIVFVVTRGWWCPPEPRKRRGRISSNLAHSGNKCPARRMRAYRRLTTGPRGDPRLKARRARRVIRTAAGVAARAFLQIAVSRFESWKAKERETLLYCCSCNVNSQS